LLGPALGVPGVDCPLPRRLSRHILSNVEPGGEWGTAIMPTYVYRCDQCQETFERVETMSEHGASKPRCPKCGGDQVVSVPAPFTAKTAKKS
jgi:putative FmdB family regulatory protein